MKRRAFIKKSSIATLGGMGLTSDGLASRSVIGNDPEIPGPSAAQQAWMDLGFGLFVHFGINTYYDQEWSDGTLNPAGFHPDKLDTKQWCRAAREAGMKYVVITTKHHDGFCLWPTAHTRYSVASSPFKKDVLAELANSAAKHGLKLGFYYSLWDRHEKSHDADIDLYVNDFMLPQLEELLTGYGDIVELWFDGFWKYQKTGWSKKLKEIDGEAGFQEKNQQRDMEFVQAWRNEGAYWWQMDHVYQTVKNWQPNCLVMNNSTTAYPGVPLHPVDIRSGEKYMEVTEDKKVWDWLGKDIYLPLQIETTLSVEGRERFTSGSWFWHEWDHSVRSRDEILKILGVARKMNANLLLNAGVSDRGLLRPEDEETLMELRG